MKLELSCLFIIIEIISGGKMTKPTHQSTQHCQISRWQYNDLGMFSLKGMGKISLIEVKWMPKSMNIFCKKIWYLLLRVLSYLLITFSSKIRIPSIQLILWKSGCLKIMLMSCNGQVSPRTFIRLGTCGNFWKFESEKEHQQISIARMNGKK